MSIRNEPLFFIQTEDLTLYAYWRTDVLAIDLKINRGEKITILKRSSLLPLTYTPISIEEFQREKVAS